MTPLERAARVLCSDDGCYPDFEDGYLNSRGEWVEPGTPRWHEYIPTARAVLQAIREPSEAMQGDRVVRAAAYAGDTDEVWRTMIDAALEEG